MTEDILTENPGPSRRIGVALSCGAFLGLLLIWFRFEKAAALGLDLGFLDALTLMAPEIGGLLVLEGALILLAPVRGRWLGSLWWILCIGLNTLAYAGALLEQIFFLHTQSRLNLSLIQYGLDNYDMLQDLILSGVDSHFESRARTVGGVLLLALLVGFVFRLRPHRAWIAMIPAGILALLLPATAPIIQADLAAGTMSELLRGSGGSEAAERRAAPLVLPPEAIYERPKLTETAPAPSPAPVDGEEEGPLHVVLVILESTRFDPLAPYHPAGSQLAPELATVAENSWVVEEMYTTVSHTSKALVSILCGMFPRLDLPILETLEGGLPLTCLPHLLGEAGYRTVFLQTAMGTFENRPGLVRNLGYASAAFMETMERPGFERTGYLGIDEFAMLEPAQSVLDGAGSTPLFLTLLTLTPHHPYDVPGQPPPGLTSDLSRHYLEALRHQDRFVGEVYRTLETKGLLESTAFILVGDHGEAFGEHRRRQHDIVPYEEVIRVPAFLHLPSRFGKPRRIEGLRQLTDLMPTILELTGTDWQGKTLGKSLLSDSGAPQIITSCWYPDYCLAMRRGDRKYVYHYGIRPTEVFDLATDRLERRNLADEVDPGEILAAEEQMLAFKLGIDGFWAQQPEPNLDGLWWMHAEGATSP